MKLSKSNELCRTPRRSTPSTRVSANNGGDDSPILSQSQEPVVTWKWSSENTPVRSTTGSSKSKLERLSKKSPIGNLYKASITSSASKIKNSTAAPTSSAALTNSPKGLFKFQEEMRKIQFDNEHVKCDTVNVDLRSLSNIVCPMNVDHPSVEDEDYKMDGAFATTSNYYHTAAADNISDTLEQDLLNNSDFDQMLLTCAENVERKLSQKHMAIGNVQNAPADTVKGTTPSLSNDMNLFNDESIDDILGNIDDSFIMHTINKSKLSRHKSMPQELLPQKLQPKHQPNQSSLQQQQPSNSNYASNRKSFARHESMPVEVTDINVQQTNVHNSKYLLQKFPAEKP